MKTSHYLAIMAALLSVNVQAAEQKKAVPGATSQPKSYFYTGKPYDKDLDVYTFVYRNYNPRINRWTTPDPSGFPDGCNNVAYKPVPTIQLDPLGLNVTAVYSITSQTLVIGDDSNEFLDHKFYNCNSGDNNYNDQNQVATGPLPTGNYNIYTRHQFAADYYGHMAFILDPNDSKTLNDQRDGRSDGITRGNFRIHVSGNTEGCIATSQIDQIGQLLESTSYSKTLYTITSGADTFQEYFLGTLFVTE